MSQSSVFESTPNNLEAFWMPFTANRQFKSKPRLFTGAKDMHYTTVEGRKVLDGTAGLWCVNAGHGRARDHGGGARPGRPARLCAGLPDGPSRGLRIRRAPHQSAGRGFRPCLLHQFRIGIGRHRPQDRHRLSPRPRRGHAHAADRARARLSRRRLRRHLGRRHRRQPQDLRQPADRRRSSAPHPQHRQERLQPRPAGERRRARRRARAPGGAA